MREGHYIHDGDLQIEVCFALVKSVYVEVLKLAIGNVQQRVGLALIQAGFYVFNQTFQSSLIKLKDCFNQTFPASFALNLFEGRLLDDGVSCPPEVGVSEEELLMEKLDGFFLAEFVVFEGQKVEVLVLAEFEILIFENFFEKCSFGQDGGCEFYFIELGLF